MNNIIETRIDLCRLAECCLAFEQSKIAVKSRSALVAACVDALADVLKKNNATVPVEDNDAAEAIIQRVLKPKVFDVSALNISALRQSVLEQAAKFNPLNHEGE